MPRIIANRGIVLQAARVALVVIALGASAAAAQAATPEGWPPVLGRAYPDIPLRDAEGRAISLRSFRDRIVLVELVGMSCPACQSFSGARSPEIGPFGGVVPQADLPSLREAVRSHAGIELGDPRLVVVQVLLYDLTAKAAPRPADAKAWASHFDLGPGSGVLVVAADASLVGPASYAMIPGFHVLDEDLTFVRDAAGHQPRHDLWKDALPELGRRVKLLAIPEGGRAGLRLPNANVTDADGSVKGLRVALGRKRTLLYAYSGCCGHCSEQLAALEKSRTRLPDGAAWVGLEYLGNAKSCAKPTKAPSLPGERFADADGSACGALGVTDFTLFVLDERGTILLRGGLEDVDRAADLLRGSSPT